MSLVNVVLILLVSYAAARLTWNLLDGAGHYASGVDDARIPDSTGSSAGRAPAAVLPEVPSLFGLAQQSSPPPAANPEVIPETRLNLRLNGIIATDDQQTARAIIAVSGAGEEAYAIGDSLPGRGVKLEKIYRDHVIIGHRGKLEALYLHSDEEPGARRWNASVDPDDARRMTALRQAWQKGAGNFIGEIRPVPVKENGSVVGYRLEGGETRLLERVGLRNGDVVQTLNGLPVDDLPKLRGMLRDPNKLGGLEIGYLRDNVPQTLVIGAP